ncbi:hypothetical protein AVEN_197091-1 [Araneus ventricosus]|uniref:Uncharacterized protein n=1 Tax=Araneus ventricosus TaxID=182803 RepID=A0A4Y2TF48_ARAVE|nr:hypothetical protein AVEN_197091-1 [Araneus ventricosus]
MYTSSKQLEYNNGKIQKVHQIYLFNALIFVKVWLNAPKGEDAPVNYLKFRKCLSMYEKYYPGVAGTALLTFSRHLWHLIEEDVICFLRKYQTLKRRRS